MVKIGDLPFNGAPAANDLLVIVDVSTDETKSTTIDAVAGSQALIDINSLNSGPANASGTDAIAIGFNSTADSNNGIAIGNAAVSSGVGVAQIGQGTNSVQNTLAFQSNIIANEFGIQAPDSNGVPTSAAAFGSLYVDTANDDLYYKGAGGWLKANGGDDLPLTTNGDLLSFSGGNLIRVGIGAADQVLTSNGTSFTWEDPQGGNGDYFVVNSTGAPAAATGTNAIAIGQSASASQTDSVQIGAGANSVATTLKFRDTFVANTISLEIASVSTNPASAREGTIIFNTTDQALQIYSGGNWVAAGGGGGGSDYVVVNSTGNAAAATGVDAIAIGKESIASSQDSLAIGRDATATTGLRSVAIGVSADTIGTQATAIGFGANVPSGIASLAVGALASATGDRSVALGGGNGSSNSARVTVSDSAQICSGLNSTPGTLQFRDETIASAQGIQAKTGTSAPTVAANDGSLFVNTGANEFYFRSSGTWQTVGGGGGSSDYVAVNSTGTAASAAGTDAIAIGEGASSNGSQVVTLGALANSTSGTRGLALGYNSAANGNGNISLGETSSSSGGSQVIAIGANSVASGTRAVAIGGGATSATSAQATAQDAIQLGDGINNTSNTLQYRDNTIANTQGLQAKTGTSAPTAAAADGTLFVDTTGTGTLYVRSGGVWRSVALT